MKIASQVGILLKMLQYPKNIYDVVTFIMCVLIDCLQLCLAHPLYVHHLGHDFEIIMDYMYFLCASTT